VSDGPLDNGRILFMVCIAIALIMILALVLIRWGGL
jgi:hypothetical protein